MSIEEPVRPVITIFRSRLRDDAVDAYEALAPEIERLAREQPGFVEIKTFTAEDGERVTLVTFTDEASQAAWREHPAHRDAQRRGRDEFYVEYRIIVCSPQHEHTFPSRD